MAWRGLRRLVGVRCVYRLVLAGVSLVLLLLIARAGQRGGQWRGMRLPLALPLGAPLETEWVEGESREGFLQVDKVLKDPRTTKDPLTAETYDQQVGGGNRLEMRQGNGKVDDRAEDDSFHDDTKVLKHVVGRDIHDVLTVMNERVDDKGNGSDFQSVMSYNQNYKPHLTQDLFSPGYHIPNPDLCKAGPVLITILVISAPGHFLERDGIRQTWGTFGGREDTVFGFLVGIPDNETVMEDLARESEQFGDIVINTIKDLYQNLSLKTLSAFSWVSLYCPSSMFLLKVDDDMFVQVPRLLQLAKETLSKSKDKKVIIGNISHGWKPVRNTQSKYFISEAQFNKTTYPDFATGPSYLVSRTAMDSILESALQQPYIHLEDVFLTGVVAEMVGVERRHNEEFRNNAVRIPARFMGCTLLKTITIHKVRSEEQKEFEEESLNPRCGKRSAGYIEVSKISPKVKDI